MEEQVFRRLPKKLSSALVHQQPSLLEYKSPTFLEMPPVTTFFIEEPDGAGPFGAKEVGQGPLLPIMPALSNAVFDAVGARVKQIPITPQCVLKALKSADKSYGPSDFPEVPWPEATRGSIPLGAPEDISAKSRLMTDAAGGAPVNGTSLRPSS